MMENENLGSAPEEEKDTPKESKFDKWMDNDYAPCTKLLIYSVIEKDASVGGRLFLGTMGLVGAVVMDPVFWVMKKLDIDPGSSDYDPNSGGFL